MEQLRRIVEERVGLTRGDLVGVAVALLGCVVATVVALRVPLLTAAQEAVAAPEDGPVVQEEVPGGTGDAVPLPGSVVVHVAGAVAAPGVVELPGGARVADAVAAAGGALPGAALGAVNLARAVVDGEQVVVPTVDEAAAAPGDAGAVEDGAGGVLADGRLDLNRATAAELEQLPGIGPVLAGRIVAHREEHGPFGEPAALRDVPGIGESTWLQLRELVGVP